MHSLFREHRLLRFSGPEEEKDVRDIAPAAQSALPETQIPADKPTEGAVAVATDKREAANKLADEQKAKVADHADRLADLRHRLAAEGSASGSGGQTAV